MADVRQRRSIILYKRWEKERRTQYALFIYLVKKTSNDIYKHIMKFVSEDSWTRFLRRVGGKDIRMKLPAKIVSLLKARSEAYMRTISFFRESTKETEPQKTPAIDWTSLKEVEEKYLTLKNTKQTSQNLGTPRWISGLGPANHDMVRPMITGSWADGKCPRNQRSGYFGAIKRRFSKSNTNKKKPANMLRSRGRYDKLQIEIPLPVDNEYDDYTSPRSPDTSPSPFRDCNCSRCCWYDSSPGSPW